MKKLFRTLFAAALCCLTFKATDACTNFIITRGASSDGSVMVSYAADSHSALRRPLQHLRRAANKPGSDAARSTTGTRAATWRDIPQAGDKLYATIGNMNEHSLIIAEIDLRRPRGAGRLDGSASITARSSTSPCNAPRLPARRSGSSSSWPTPTATLRAANRSRSPIPNEAWIMELIGKGCELDAAGQQHPQGHRLGSSPHSRRIRVGTRQPVAHHDLPARRPRELPLRARRHRLRPRDGLLRTARTPTSASATPTAPADFGTVRGCDARVWAFFRTVADGMDANTRTMPWATTCRTGCRYG